MMKHLMIAVLAGVAAVQPAAAQNPTQIKAVKDGARACVGCNLFQADFAYLDVSGRDLAKARLRQADLTVITADRTNFDGADLSIANAFGARFEGASLRNANLETGAFVGAFFGGANFAGASLTGANFSGAELADARGLTRDQLATACGDGATTLPAGFTIPSC
jgi:uncharacterized protein YjbI with pentapeptide repeats